VKLFEDPWAGNPFEDEPFKTRHTEHLKTEELVYQIGANQGIAVEVKMFEQADMCQKFQSTETQTLARRIVWRNYTPRDLPKAAAKDFKNYMKKVNPENHSNAILDYQGNSRRTPSYALEEIERLKNKTGPPQHKLLDELEAHIKNNF